MFFTEQFEVEPTNAKHSPDFSIFLSLFFNLINKQVKTLVRMDALTLSQQGAQCNVHENESTL